MAIWLPWVKIALPYITQIVAAALPAFTPKSGGDKQDEMTAKQIAELQAAATHNTEYVKTLAKQLQDTVEGIDVAAVSLQAELTFYRRIAMFSAALAVVALIIATVALLK
jgi:hypothetical protein